MLTKVNIVGMCVAKHQPHVLPDMGNSIRPIPIYWDHEPYHVVHLCEIYSKPRLFIRPLLIFIGAHETTSLSWFFCVMTKEQEKKQKTEYKLMFYFSGTSK